MLSQKIVRQTSNVLYEYKYWDKNKIDGLRKLIESDIELFVNSHSAIISHDPIAISKISYIWNNYTPISTRNKKYFTPKLQDFYFVKPNVNLKVTEFIDMINDVLYVNNTNIDTNYNLLNDYIENHLPDLAKSLNLVTEQYAIEWQNEILRLKNIESYILAITLITLTLEAFFIFVPMIRSIRLYRGRLERINFNLKNALKAKEQFINLTTHELRTPLTIVKSYASLFADGYKIKKNRSYLEKIQYTTDELLESVNSFLEWKRIKSEKIVLNIQSVKISNLVDSVVNDLYVLSYKKNQTLKFLDKTKRVFIKTDWEMLKRVLINLVSNAIKYTHKKWKIVVRSFIHDWELVIKINDNWIWIKEGDIDIIFKEFGRVGSGEVQWITWTGLWLPYANKLIKALGWKILISSVIWKWSEFAVFLPLNRS